MEEQMRQLYGQLEQLTIQMGQLSAQMQRLQDDQDLRLRQLDGGKKSSGAKVKPDQNQQQAAANAEDDSGLEVIEDPVDLGGNQASGLDQPGNAGGSEIVGGAIETAAGPKPLGTLPGGVVDGTRLEEIQPGEDASLMPEQVETASLYPGQHRTGRALRAVI